ncbi:hypothetical protein Tco_0272417, partial [Tanacetum coccineum]
WEVRTLIKDHNCIQSRSIKACTSGFLSDHVIKLLATNPDILVRAVKDQMQKQFDDEVLKMKAFRAKRIATDRMTGPWPGQILTIVRVDTIGKRYCVRHIHENMKSQFKGGVYNEMLWNAAKATSDGEFNKKMGELIIQL